MIPRILEYEDGRVKVTPEAFAIPEIHSILDRFDNDADPYLAYISAMSYPDGPYAWLPDSDRKEAALYDIKQSIGDFDEDDELVQPAIDKLRSYWQSTQTLLADELEEELHRWRKYLRDNPISADGSDGSTRDRLMFLDKVEKIALTARNVS